jgi:hypothetical protein
LAVVVEEVASLEQGRETVDVLVQGMMICGV